MNSSSRFLPPELLHIVLSELPASGISIACRVSRAFRAEGQRILYHSVDLSECDRRTLRSWYNSINRHDYFAAQVHSLVLRLPFELDSSEGVKLGRAMKRCTNLKELTVLHPTRRMYNAGRGTQFHIGSAGQTYWSWLVTECSFRLKKFANTGLYIYHTAKGIKEFWDAQVDLNVLSIPDSYEFPLPELDSAGVQLPNLKALETTATALPPAVRPLRALQLHFADHHTPTQISVAFHFCQKHASTLQTLNIVWHDKWATPLHELMRSAAAVAPNLRYFRICPPPEETPGRIEVTMRRLNLLEQLRKFPCLEELVLQLRVYDLRVTDTDASSNEPECGVLVTTDDGLEHVWEFAHSIMHRSSTTLRRVEVGVELCPRSVVMRSKIASVILSRSAVDGEVVSREVNGWEWNAGVDFFSIPAQGLV